MDLISNAKSGSRIAIDDTVPDRQVEYTSKLVQICVDVSGRDNVGASFRAASCGGLLGGPEPERLKDELGKRGLSLTAGTVGTAKDRGREAFEQSRRDAFAS